MKWPFLLYQGERGGLRREARLCRFFRSRTTKCNSLTTSIENLSKSLSGASSF